MRDRLLALPVVGTALRMQERYRDDAADALAAAIGLFGFLSLFPLLALLLAAVGFVLGDDSGAQARAVDLVIESVPALGSLAGGEGQVATAIDAIAENPGTLLGFGTIGLVLSALRIASGAQQATAVVFRRELPTGLVARREQVLALVVVGFFALAGAAVSGTVGVDLGSGLDEALLSVVGVVIAYVLDVALFMLAYRLFTPGEGPEWRTLWPGSLLAAAGWVALKLFGTAYVTNQAQSANNTYGALGSIIGLLLLFYLVGRLFLYGAELAALLADHIDDDAPIVGPVVEPRPLEDVAPAPAELARLAGTAAVLGFLAKVLGTD